MDDWQQVAHALVEQIRRATEPAKMSKADALATLELIQSDIDGDIDALRDEIESAEEEG